MRKYPELSKEMRIKIIQYWSSNHDNSSTVLVIKFKLPRHQIDEVIDEKISKL